MLQLHSINTAVKRMRESTKLAGRKRVKIYVEAELSHVSFVSCYRRLYTEFTL